MEKKSKLPLGLEGKKEEKKERCGSTRNLEKLWKKEKEQLEKSREERERFL